MPEAEILLPAFFDRSASQVARALIGTTLVRRCDQGTSRYTVTETEAYEGTHDLACHSSKGCTARTQVMFGPAGRFYIYRIYGLHWMLNVVTGGKRVAAAVLIRGVAGIDGPGRVAAALKIDASLNGQVAEPASSLWFEKHLDRRRFRVRRTPRIGVDYAGPVWSAKELRYVMDPLPRGDA